MKTNRGFVNPQGMIALTIILLVLAISIPPVIRTLQRRSRLKALSTLRSAVARYAADTKTKGPLDLSDLTKEGKYLEELPSVGLSGYHAKSARVGALTDDTGGWVYSSWPGDPREGSVWINCTHTDDRGTSWSAY